MLRNNILNIVPNQNLPGLLTIKGMENPFSSKGYPLHSNVFKSKTTKFILHRPPFSFNNVLLFPPFAIRPQKMSDDLLHFKALIVAEHPSRRVVDAVKGEDILENLHLTSKGEEFFVPLVQLFFNPFPNPKPHIFKRGRNGEGYT